MAYLFLNCLEKGVPFMHLPFFLNAHCDFNVGPNTVATTRDDMGPSATDLYILYSAVLGLSANGGGDEPEFCLSGIKLATLSPYSQVDPK